MARPSSEDDLIDSAEEIGYVPHLKNISRSKKKSGGKAKTIHARPESAPIAAEIAEQAEDKFEISYKAARHEAIWLEESLASFFHQKWFDDVLRMVKGGKEASVYLCEGNETTGVEFQAAKVYRPRRFRNLKNDWLYREGRTNLDDSGNQITNKGMQHAIRKRTEYGRELMHTSWLEHEFKTLTVLHGAGADVPKPFASGPNAILMQYFGDEVMSAPTLNEVDLDHKEARPLFDRVLHNIDLMLSNGRIHGDLSAFNILYWEGEIVLIDFPQAVHPKENQSAYRIFERDVVRICEYFQRQGVRSNPRQIAAEMWKNHHHLFVPNVDPKMLGEDQEDERDIWESLKNVNH
jgi:RIO kinase 1